MLLGASNENLCNKYNMYLPGGDPIYPMQRPVPLCHFYCMSPFQDRFLQYDDEISNRNEIQNIMLLLNVFCVTDDVDLMLFFRLKI